MLVSESTMNFSSGTQIQVISTEGFSWNTAFDSSATVESVKRLAMQYFYPNENSASSEQFRVIYPAECRTLMDHHTLYDEHIKENEILLFVRRRNAANAATASTRLKNDVNNRTQALVPMPLDSDVKPPTAADILAATKDLPVSAKSQPPATLNAHPTGANRNYHYPFGLNEDSDSSNQDFQVELRKIVVSLISVMAVLLKGNPDAELICREMQGRIKRRLSNSGTKPIEGTKFSYPPAPEVECTPMGIVVGLTEAKKREFRPNSKALEGLKGMGFKEEQIVEALRANKNSKDAACEWIMSGKSKFPIEVDDITGLDRNGHLFIALVTSPIVRLGLNNPKTLLAFLNILESPASANTWLADTDTAPVLSTIFKIYHAEKNAAPSDA